MANNGKATLEERLKVVRKAKKLFKCSPGISHNAVSKYCCISHSTLRLWMLLTVKEHAQRAFNPKGYDVRRIAKTPFNISDALLAKLDTLRGEV